MKKLTSIIVRLDNPTGMASVPDVFVNGKFTPIQINTPIDVTEDVLNVLRDSTLTIEELPAGEGSPPESGTDEGAADIPGGIEGGAATDEAEPEQDVPAADPPAHEPEATEPAPAPVDSSFDADAVITGTIPTVEKKLAGLTAEQLAAVRTAEEDREVSRIGVMELIDKAAADLAADKE